MSRTRFFVMRSTFGLAGLFLASTATAQTITFDPATAENVPLMSWPVLMLLAGSIAVSAYWLGARRLGRGVGTVTGVGLAAVLSAGIWTASELHAGSAIIEVTGNDLGAPTAVGVGTWCVQNSAGIALVVTAIDDEGQGQFNNARCETESVSSVGQCAVGLVIDPEDGCDAAFGE